MKNIYAIAVVLVTILTTIFYAKLVFAGQGTYAFSFNYIKSNPSLPSDTSTQIYFYNPSPSHTMKIDIQIGGGATSTCGSGTPTSGICGTFPDPTGTATYINETVTLSPRQYLQINPESDPKLPANQTSALGVFVTWANPVNDSNKLVVDVSQLNHDSSGNVISNTQIPVNADSVP